ncbi:MAG: AMP-binding protein [Catenulispora sp.]|nr:AMP-binding protein [Catenulispora sp.]
MIGLLRSGLLRPTSPARLPRMLAVLTRLQVTPAFGLAMAAARWPERPAIHDDAGTLTYAELEHRATALAVALHERLGVRQGHTVAVLRPNERGFVEAAAAVSRLGADLLLVSTGLAEPRLREILPREGVSTLISPATDLEELITAGRDGEPGRPRRPGRLILLTSGTSGTPTSAPRRLSPVALALPFASILDTVGLRSGEPMMIAPPLFHGLGLMWYGMALALGCPVILTTRFDPESALEAMARHRATVLVAVPIMLQRLLACRSRPAPDLHTVICGGSALHPDLAAAFMDDFGDVLYNLYGSTEVGWAALATPRDLRESPGTVGRPPLGTTVRVLAPDGRVGPVYVGGGLALDAYPGGGSRPTLDGLTGTGDLGHRTADGRLFIDGREDDMIVSGSEKVYPQEVENLLASHPAVRDVAVLGVPDQEYGQRLIAYVEPAREVTAETLKEFTRNELARYKVPCHDRTSLPAAPWRSTRHSATRWSPIGRRNASPPDRRRQVHPDRCG